MSVYRFVSFASWLLIEAVLVMVGFPAIATVLQGVRP